MHLPPFDEQMGSAPNPLAGEGYGAEPRLPQPVRNIINTCGPAFLTGSRAYGPYEHPGDWDVCLHIPYRDSPKLVELLDSLHKLVEPSSHHLADTLCTNEGKLNLIYLGTTDLWCWFYATQMMKALPPIPDRTSRYAAFEHLRAVVKAQPHYGDLGKLSALIYNKQKDDNEPDYN